ncbi:MAG: sigma-54-dependent Fis family transcriptional regulator [Planctomycetota bacterium]|nr:MAG: sigma-54-dependent Fis family transcriptional regulator [Planctomycetota bacterium]
MAEHAKEHAKEKADKGAVLVVDDDSDIRLSLEMLLQYEGYACWTAKDGREALARLEREAAAEPPRRPVLVLSDVKMPDMDGLQLLEKVREKEGAPPMILISGHADVAMAVEAVKKGAADFLEKPLDQNRVLVSLRGALRAEKLAQENQKLKRALGGRYELVGKSPAIRALAAQLARVAQSDAAVLITGENGSGKEVVARNLHLSSPRASGPFVAVNCAAIPAELIESELFGHEKGSFTGAHERRIGHFEAADGGTLFLDEIGDMPLAAQSKVLRALETREITRVGGTRPMQVDIRVLAATNADLAAAVEAKAFRMDLFYRLNVIPLRVPSLRERLDDIAPLAEQFLRQIGERAGRAARTLDADAASYLRTLTWPGNVRQLRNAIEAANVFAESNQISKADLEQVFENGPALSTPSTVATLPADGDPFRAPTFEEFKNQSEALFIRLKLAENNGNVKRTAEQLGMQRSHMYKKLERYGIKP